MNACRSLVGQMVQRRLTAICAAVCIMGAAACERARSPVLPLPPNVSSHVTDDVARTLDANGRFVLSSPESPDGSPIISEARARQLAAAYLRTFGVFHLQTYERQRGGKINLSEVNVGERAYFARTPYGPVPKGLHPSARKFFGPYYLVPLQTHGALTILLAVSAFNVDTQIGADGQLILPRLDGNGFIGAGIPAGHEANFAMSPEDAATEVARATKRKIKLVPELVLPGVAVMPVFALWKVSLESEVGMSRKDEQSHEKSREIFFGRFRPDNMLVPKRVQKKEETRTKSSLDAQGRLGPDITYRVAVREGHSVEFDAVTVKPEDR